MNTNASTLRASKKRLTHDEIAYILTWLKNPTNFAYVYGATDKTAPGKPATTANIAWQNLATLVNKRNKGRLSLTGKSIMERFSRIRRTYLEIKNNGTHVAWGLTDADRKKGITSTQQKLNTFVPHFDRFDALFGHGINNASPLDEDSLVSSPSAVTECRQRLIAEEGDEYGDEDADQSEVDADRSDEGRDLAHYIDDDDCHEGHHGDEYFDGDVERGIEATQAEIEEGDAVRISNDAGAQRQKRAAADNSASMSSERSRGTDAHEKLVSPRPVSPKATRRSSFAAALENYLKDRISAQKSIAEQKLELNSRELELKDKELRLKYKEMMLRLYLQAREQGLSTEEHANAMLNLTQDLALQQLNYPFSLLFDASAVHGGMTAVESLYAESVRRTKTESDDALIDITDHLNGN
ncbi:hypothetical protein DFQ27_003372 [Actinomortierella ambigua]|uniref:Uncharacterized protein n=1 Tax=Actinomortierella ambigua TaxID=1343610 RepID=A0A9P6QMZ1_9FUNG|nr:hypothetical protein DFQ27_003372 [Actinomortierella ambigua]